LKKSIPDIPAAQIAAHFNPIAVVAENSVELASALRSTQGAAHADILTVADLLHLASSAERKMEAAGIAASYRVGATLHSTPSGPSCNAYKYPRLGTAVFLERKSAAWTLMRAYRLTTWPRQVGRQLLVLTVRQKQHVLKHAMRTHGITSTEATVAIAVIAQTS